MHIRGAAEVFCCPLNWSLLWFPLIQRLSFPGPTVSGLEQLNHCKSICSLRQGSVLVHLPGLAQRGVGCAGERGAAGALSAPLTLGSAGTKAVSVESHPLAVVPSTALRESQAHSCSL